MAGEEPPTKQVMVTCGLDAASQKRGVFWSKRGEIMCKCDECAGKPEAERWMPLADFEKHGGRGASKKAKQSIKVEGTTMPLGQWLRDRDVLLPHERPPAGAVSPTPAAPPPRAAAVAAAAAAAAAAEPRPPPRGADRRGGAPPAAPRARGRVAKRRRRAPSPYGGGASGSPAASASSDGGASSGGERAEARRRRLPELLSVEVVPAPGAAAAPGAAPGAAAAAAAPGCEARVAILWPARPLRTLPGGVGRRVPPGGHELAAWVRDRALACALRPTALAVEPPAAPGGGRVLRLRLALAPGWAPEAVPAGLRALRALGGARAGSAAAAAAAAAADGSAASGSVERPLAPLGRWACVSEQLADVTLQLVLSFVASLAGRGDDDSDDDGGGGGGGDSGSGGADSGGSPAV